MNIFQIQKSIKPIHCVKTFQIRSFFLVRIQSECWKIRTRKNSLFGHFSRSVVDKNSYIQLNNLAVTNGCHANYVNLKSYLI